MITKLAISGYRSLRDVVLPLGPLNVITGPNGSGKSSLYRALRLLADVAQGGVIRALAAEGGLASTLWAGPESISRAMKRREERLNLFRSLDDPQNDFRRDPKRAFRSNEHPCQIVTRSIQRVASEVYN